MEEERTILASLEVFDFSDVERVIAGGMDIDDTGDEIGYRFIDKRNVRSQDEGNLESLLGPACKMRTELFLVFRQDADAKAPCHRQDAVHV